MKKGLILLIYLISSGCFAQPFTTSGDKAYFGNWTLGSTGVWPSNPGFSFLGGDETFGVSSAYGQISLQIDGAFRQQEIGKANYFMDEVGLGTFSPEVKLHLQEGVPTGIQALNGQTKLAVDVANGGFLEFRNTSDNNTFSGLLFSDNNLGGYVAFRNYPDDKLHLGAYGGISFEVGTDNNIANKTERMRIDGNGNVGIGTISPSAKLHVISQTAGTAGLLVQGQNGDNWFPYSDGKNYIRGTTVFADMGGNVGIGTSNPQSKLEVHGATAIGQYTNGTAVIDAYNSYAYFGCNTASNGLAVGPNGNVGIGTTSPQSKLDVNGAINVSAGGVSVPPTGLGYGLFPHANVGLGLYSVNGGISFWGGSTATEYMRITGGNVGIGTTSPDAKLAVSGQIHAQEVKVSVTVPGPDYVFEKDYKLTSLEEIKNYIDQNKHLPEVPSAKEMEKNGVQLGEMNMLLLKKIEELTLHMIEQNRNAAIMQQQIKIQQDQIENLKQTVKIK